MFTPLGAHSLNMPRFYCPAPLQTGESLELPAGAARHVQVLRMQPGDRVTLFNSGMVDDGVLQFTDAGEYEASITRMGRTSVAVLVGQQSRPQREPPIAVHLVLGVPANDRMDWLVEKATELGVASIRPLMTERSVLRLSGERAEKKVAHWQSVAISACEQCGANRVPLVHGMMQFAAWLNQPLSEVDAKVVLSLHTNAVHLRAWQQSIAKQPSTKVGAVTVLSGPEGGLSMAEEAAAINQGFTPLSLGDRILRSETAALSALASLVL